MGLGKGRIAGEEPPDVFASVSNRLCLVHKPSILFGRSRPL